MGQAMTTTQFFLHGRKRFTQTGWIKAQQSYRPGAFLAEAQLEGRVFGPLAPHAPPRPLGASRPPPQL